MIRRTPRLTRTGSLVLYTTLFRTALLGEIAAVRDVCGGGGVAGVFDWAMRLAAAILLGLAILIVAGTIAFNVMAATEFHELRQNFSNTQMVMSIVLSLENGALPLFGAALLWRLDRRWGGTGKAAE